MNNVWRTLKNGWAAVRMQRDDETQAEHSAPARQYVAHSPTQKGGEQAENQACAYLQAHGLQLVARNWACAAGEIDLIMRDADVWVFIEVKWRRSTAYGGALNAITPQKLKRLQRAIALYVQQHPRAAECDCRVDAVLIEGIGAQQTIEWLRNIDMPA